MKIAIASGKGGTGKTSLAVSMLIANADRARLLDCDVEEPNCQLFLPSQIISRTVVEQQVPEIDSNLCRLCGRCVEACQFNALAMTGAGLLVFEELCHGCGSCHLECPYGAIEEKPVQIGEVMQARCHMGAEMVSGLLTIGHASTPAVIRAVQKTTSLQNTEFTLIDSPPGTGCPFIATVDHADFVLLVTEATPFGLNDLKLAIAALQKINIPFAVIINRTVDSQNLVKSYCNDNGFPVWMQIREDRHIAETYAQGGNLLDVIPEMRNHLRQLLEKCAK